MSQITHKRDNDYYLNGIKTQENKVIQQVIDDFLQPIEVYIIGKGGMKKDAEDIFFSALMVIFKKVKNDELTLTAPFYNYLISICRNLWLKECRRKGHESGVMITDDMVYIDEQEQVDAWTTEELRHNLILEKLELLSPKCKEIIILSFQKGLKLTELAKKMGFSSKNFASKSKAECKKKLIQKVQEDDRYLQLI